MEVNETVISPRVKAVENMVARARAKTGKKPGPPACSTCHIPLWVSFFFDGTNNHKDRDFPKGHSNVVGLFHAHEDDPRKGIGKFYYEGCGTSFRFGARHERRSVHHRGGVTYIDDNGYNEAESRINQGLGYQMDKRLEKAIFEFEYYIEDRRRERRVDEINIAAFGFSRGAATARAFVHWVAAHSKVRRTGDKLTYDGIPLNFKFLGIFDTVEAVGTGQNNAAKLIKTSIPGFVQKCLHAVAVHELRPSFALTGTNVRRYVTVVSPGAHSDVGGGYEADQQGRNQYLSRINLLQMLDHARGAELKMLSLDEMKTAPLNAWTQIFQFSFSVPAEAHEALAAYMQHIETRSGPLRAVFLAHMKWFWRWLDAGLAAEDGGQKFRRYWRDKAPASAERRKELAAMTSVVNQKARTPAGKGHGSFLSDQPSVPITDRSVPPAIEDILENYVHDSQVGFLLYGTRQLDLTEVDYYRVRKVLVPLA